MKLPFLVVALCTIAGQGATVAHSAVFKEYQPSFQPDRLKGPPVGRPNEVLVLGSPHLSQLPETFRPEHVAPLLTRLAAWRPTAIAIENVSGLQCDALRRYPARYASSVESYCLDPTAAGRAVGLDVPTANAEVERLLANWPTAPTPRQRRHLALVFLAAGEPASALVQWIRLPKHERLPQNGLTLELTELLDKRITRRSEVSLIAAALAARLGLERLWSVDDHTADSEWTDRAAAAEALKRAWDNPASKARRSADVPLYAGLNRPNGLLDIYRAYNALSVPMLAYRADFGAAHIEPSPQAFGRRYLGYWETRNLRMVANIRDVLARHPGSRMLAIVGASHKGYYEAYLHQMHDLTLISSDAVLQ